MKRLDITIFSGAGISAESGIKTFRDAGGLWEGHDVMEVASPQAWANNKSLVNDFYNQRRRQLLSVNPNKAHYDIANLETLHNVNILTQNVDDLHERAGSTKVHHLHGELLKVRSTKDARLVYEWRKDLNEEDKCELDSPLRPDIVWFGEDVPMMNLAVDIVKLSDVLLIVGTSLQVYPAAGLIYEAPPDCKIFYIDPKANLFSGLRSKVKIVCISKNATDGVYEVIQKIC